MAQFHFVEDYERLIKSLLAVHPVETAMELAVGGKYELLGEIERDILVHAGLRNGMTVVDLGCGSGRLAHALGKVMKIDYWGIDIVEELLRYARTKAPNNYEFVLNRKLTLPIGDAAADMVCAFSVFTHLLHTETYLYLQDFRRVLKPGGRAIFSFFEFTEPNHWPVFDGTVATQRNSSTPHLNMFIERNAIELWSNKLGFEVERFIDSQAAPWGGDALGQTIAILVK